MQARINWSQLRRWWEGHSIRGQQFPVEAFDQFGKQGIPRWASNDEATQKAYDALVQKVCPRIIVVHSQGGNFGFTAALNAPDKVKALVAIEPSGAPDPAKADAARLQDVPHLIVWGDNIDKHPVWPRIAAKSDQVGAGHRSGRRQSGNF